MSNSINQLSKLFKNFAKNSGGNIAVIFGISAFAVVGAVGAAVDYGRATHMQAKVQAGADAAAIAAATSGLNDAERKELAKTTFTANFPDGSLARQPKLNIDLSDPQKVTVTVESAIKPYLMSLLGIHESPVNVVSVAGRASFASEIALVLDISGSMRASMGGQTRIAALKSAAKQLVDTVSKNGDVLIGIVPFTMNVNIGTANKKYVTGSKHKLFTGTSWAGCVFERPAPYHVSDDYSGIGEAKDGKWQAMIWPPMPNKNGQCINPSNGNNDGYQSIDVTKAGDYTSQTKGPNFNCVRHSLMDLSKDANSVRNKIDSLTSVGNQGTIIAPGISWGMRLLSPQEPFSKGTAYSKGAKKIIIVLTDGEQTSEAEYHRDSCHREKNTDKKFSFDPKQFKLSGDKLTNLGPDDMLTPYGFLRDSDPFKSNPLSWNDVKTDLKNVSLAACDEAKKKPAGGEAIEIYSIAVSTSAGPGTDVYDLLKSCASSTDNFFYADDSAALNKAFKEIAKGILQVRIMR